MSEHHPRGLVLWLDDTDKLFFVPTQKGPGLEVSFSSHKRQANRSTLKLKPLACRSVVEAP